MTTTQPMLVLVGAGGHSSDVLAVIEANQLLESDDVPGCIHVVDESSPSSRRFEGRAVEFVPNFAFDAMKPCAFIAAIGYPAPRRSVVERAQAHGYAPARPLLHPTAEVAFGARVGDGSVVFAHTWLSPWVSIGAHSFASYGTTIGHDSDIGDFVSIMPSATISGSVTIEDGALIGAGAVVLEGVTIGSNASVGAGAVVIGDVPPDVVVVGVPAQPTTQTSVVEDQL